jgi:stage II sporulation protein M
MRNRFKIFSLKKDFLESINYISEMKNYIYLSIFVFLLGGLIGFIFSDYLSGYINELIKKLIESAVDLKGIDMIAFIFKNNAGVALIVLVLGVFFGIIPLIISLDNGVVIGYVVKLVLNKGSFLELWRLLPHGIFELPAIFISFGAGIYLGMFVFAKKPLKELKRRFVKSIKVFFLIVVPLLVIAAIIEGLLISVL